jgi:hypothetical protein
MKSRNKKYIVNAAGFDELLQKLQGTRSKEKQPQPRKPKSASRSKPNSTTGG